MKKEKNTQYYYAYILIALCVALICVIMSYGISGNDFWWHLKTGEWIVNNREIPHNGIFSWIGQELTWYAQEWMSQVVYYAIYFIGGQYGIYLFCLFAAVLMLLLIYRECRENILNNILYTVLIFIFTVAVIKLYFYGRPQLFSFFFLFIELKILYDYINDKNQKGIYFIPLIAILWVNMHGGSSNLTYVLCLFFLLTGLINFTFGRIEFHRLPKKKLIHLGAVTVFSVMALFINPFGIEMVKYPYTNMADKLMITCIAEWGAPDAKSIAILILYFVPFALGLLSLLTTKKNIRGIDLLIFAFFSYMFFRSTRFIVLLVITYPFYVFHYIPQFGTLKEIKSKGDKVMTGILFAATFGLIIFGMVNSTITYKNGKLIDHELDTEFVELIKEEAPKRPCTDYDYGGDLIYYGVDVFVDGRADIYTGTPLEDYHNLTKMTVFSSNSDEYNPQTFVEDIINKYNFDAFLVNKDIALCQYLNLYPEKYKILKESDKTVYYKVIN